MDVLAGARTSAIIGAKEGIEERNELALLREMMSGVVCSPSTILLLPAIEYEPTRAVFWICIASSIRPRTPLENRLWMEILCGLLTHVIVREDLWRDLPAAIMKYDVRSIGSINEPILAKESGHLSLLVSSRT